MKSLIKSTLKNLFYKKGIKKNISGINLALPFGFHNYYEPNYEMNNVNFFNKSIHKNDVVIDIGAQLGLMTKLFSDLAGDKGQVHSFEPTPSTFKLLNETVQLNNLKNVITNQLAVCDVIGTCKFSISENVADAGNSLVDNKLSGKKEITINTTSIDNYLENKKIDKVNFVKIDAEGAEYLVLIGLKNTIETHNPIINLALHPLAIANMGHSLELIYDFAVDNKYSTVYQDNVIDKNAFCSKKNLFDVQLIPKAL